MVFWLNRWRKVDSISFWWPILWVSSIRVAAIWAFCSQARYSSVSNEIGTILKDMKWRHHKLRILEVLEKIPSLTVKTQCCQLFLNLDSKLMSFGTKISNSTKLKLDILLFLEFLTQVNLNWLYHTMTQFSVHYWLYSNLSHQLMKFECNIWREKISFLNRTSAFFAWKLHNSPSDMVLTMYIHKNLAKLSCFQESFWKRRFRVLNHQSEGFKYYSSHRLSTWIFQDCTIFRILFAETAWNMVCESGFWMFEILTWMWLLAYFWNN